MIFKSRYPDAVFPAGLTVTQHVFRNVENYKGKGQIAYVDGVSNKTILYDDIVGLINRVTKGLISRGFKKGDTAGTVLTNVLEFPLIYHGVLSAGGIVSPANPVNTVDDLAYQFQQTNAKFVFTVSTLVEKVRTALNTANLKDVPIIVLGEKPIAGTIHYDELINNDGQYIAPHIDEHDICTIPYSSGTTGRPKGVLLSHFALRANLDMFSVLNKHTGEKVTDRTYIAPVPAFHILGLGVFLLAAPFFGFKVVMMPFFDFELFLKLLQDHKVTNMSIVPPLILALVNHPNVGKYDLSHLETVGVGAAPMGIALQEAAQKKLKNTEIGQGYGMTELPFCVVTNPKGHIRNGACGVLLPNVEAKIVCTTDGKTEHGVDKDGELWIRCPNMMKGYLNDTAASSIIDKDGFLHTGDVGHFDKDGYLYIVDRAKELIKYKGFQVAPAELEAHLLGHSLVQDVAVVGKRDNSGSGDELPTAFVVRKPAGKDHPSLDEDITKFINDRVAPYKRLRGGVIFTDSIPRTATGKILRHQLRAKLNQVQAKL